MQEQKGKGIACFVFGCVPVGTTPKVCVAKSQTHREYITSFLSEARGIKIVQAGPMCSVDSTGPDIGSFLIVKAQIFAEVERLRRDNPFTRPLRVPAFSIVSNSSRGTGISATRMKSMSRENRREHSASG